MPPSKREQLLLHDNWQQSEQARIIVKHARAQVINDCSKQVYTDIVSPKFKMLGIST